LGYEYLKFSAWIKNPALARILAAPGLWTQRLTTRTPDRSMLEVAITAFQAVRKAEEPQTENRILETDSQSVIPPPMPEAEREKD
jgi:uncharacterized protein YqhQ